MSRLWPGFSWGDSPPRDADEGHLRLAFQLALRGAGTVSPNPMVGAVVVRGGRVIATGYHRKAGEAHAEVIALRRAGTAARGATLYVNLEPCSHHGRTPPCVQAILGAGVRRVVASMVDPNPRVRGRGFSALRRAGVVVDSGRLRGDARRLNEAYTRYIVHHRPFVLVRAGMSLDGRIATASGASRWITSARSRRESHALRWSFDALGVGRATVGVDDPELFARRGARLKERFVRVVLDSALRTPPDCRLVRSARRQPVRFYTTRRAPEARRRTLEAAGAEVCAVAGRRGRVEPAAVLEDLARREVASVILEGGGEVHASFLRAGLVDKVLLFVAPLLLGGRRSIPVVGGGEPDLPSAGISLGEVRTGRLGRDLWIEGYPRQVL
ncbi:MAG: bifunctional diaminohydroxyphosphoribosylaminopyrimidine deaminase/5-amino-6-(5-phosphoribosylamino)uracil reductase RibD [Acidobacteriota bacterium]